ncbi:MAG: Tetratricopeptide repeat-containing protein [Mucilaginibacter sp.]|nr:Tetratricopeptide repeat-containing protein [Mucilaginibacter sp.]
MGLFDFLKPKKNGVDKKVFHSKQYQDEITALAQTFYFDNNHDYSIVKTKLADKGLDETESNFVIDNLKKLNTEMVDNFQEELDSGNISEMKIKPNPEHQKGQVSKDQVDKYIGYGAYQMDRGDFENALELFDKAIELDDKAVLAYANKGALYFELKEYDNSLYFYNKAIELDFSNIKFLEAKMDVLFESLTADNEENFIESVKACLNVDPMSPNALIYIIQYYLKNQNIDSALSYLKTLFSKYYTENIAIRLLLDTFSLINKEKALEVFNEFENEIPHKATYQLKYCKGLYLKGRRDFEEAINIFSQLNNLQEFSWNYYQIAIIKNLQAKFDECIEYLQQTFKLEPSLKEDAKQYSELENLWLNPKFIEITN